jgi:DNA-3-methyladenine glycosylase II
MHFEYGQIEIEYLKQKDELLAKAIDRIGFVSRDIEPDLFTGLVNCIIGQQISAKALNTIWGRMLDRFHNITPAVIAGLPAEVLQGVGITMKKAIYIIRIADSVLDGNFLVDELADLPDEVVCKRLVSLAGVGLWTAEMLMIFSMQRKDIFSWNDLAIRRGFMMLHQMNTLDEKTFEEYRRIYSPYASIASLYLWEISLGK